MAESRAGSRRVVYLKEVAEKGGKLEKALFMSNNQGENNIICEVFPDRCNKTIKVISVTIPKSMPEVTIQQYN